MESLDQNQVALAEILNVLKDIRGQLGGQEERLKNVENKLYSNFNDLASTRNNASSRSEGSLGDHPGFAHRNLTIDKYPFHSTEIEIRSELLLQALQEEFQHYPGAPFKGPNTFILQPFPPLIHRWDSLVERAESGHPELLELIEFIKSLPAMKDYFSTRQENIRDGACRFDDLWTFYVPGSLALSRFPEDDQLFQVESCRPPSSPNASHLEIICSMVDFDGVDFVRTSYPLKIPRYTGQSFLRDLPIILLGYHPRRETLVERMTHRGLKFKELCSLAPGSKTMRRYEGPCFVASEGQEKLTDVSGRIIIDQVSYLRRYSTPHSLGELKPVTNIERCVCKQCTEIDLDDDNNGKFLLALCPWRIFGFVLQSKTWGQFSLDRMKTIRYNADAFEHVVLSPQSKQELKALVSAHIARCRQRDGVGFDDIMPAALKGTFMVFQGPTGVGKTLVAERVAEYCQTPLLFVSVYDKDFEALISDAKDSILSLAQRWQALLVVTDADLLLDTASSRSNVRHGALVSTFLLALEYYRGLIILNTSQSDPLNEAISRSIHLVLKFNELSEADFLKILNTFLKQTTLKNNERSFVLEYVKNISIGQRLSGRQIRTVVQVAISACEAESRNLQSADIIRAFATAFNLEYELNLIESDDMYTHNPSQGDSALDLELSTWPTKIWSVPSDERMPLSFSRDNLSFMSSTWGLESVIQLKEVLTRTGNFQVLDWGWPRGVWHPQKGLEYTMYHQSKEDNSRLSSPLSSHSASEPQREHEPTIIPKEASLEWRDKNWTFGPHRRSGSQVLGKPWQRLLLCQDVDTPRVIPWGVKGEPNTICFPDLPLLAIRGDIPVSFRIEVAKHITLQRYSMTRNQFTMNNQYIDLKTGFHFTYFDTYFDFDKFYGDISKTTWPIGDFYDNPDRKFRKCSFTMLMLPEDGGTVDTDAWTMLCMTADHFWGRQSYATLKSPSLKCQSIYFIALALHSAAHRWRDLLVELDQTISDGDAYLSPNVLQNSFFVEDDSYSNSRKYFWAIRVITEFIKILNDSIEQWKLYREARVEPFLEPKPEHFRDIENLGRPWYSVAAADKEASAACLELVGVKHNLDARLEEIKVMRDGLFNASAVIESRASTRLGENVKLLTYMTILFLPLAYCTSIWSINEDYGRARLAWVSILVAFGTYFVTFNLGGLVKLLRSAISVIYMPFKKKIEQDMVWNNEWRDVGKAFQTFRLNRQDQTPTEWYIPWFAIEQATRSVWNFLSWKKKPRAPGPMEVRYC